MDVVDDLAGALFPLRIGDRTTAATTRRITLAITSWAHGRGWAARTEARVGVKGDEADDAKVGFLDVIVRRGRDEQDLAIEIDSADKPWSVVKLRHAAASGMHAIWVRWGDDSWAGVYDEIDVIQLPVSRRPQTRALPGQLQLWARLR